jgi:hypothetical protein
MGGYLSKLSDALFQEGSNRGRLFSVPTIVQQSSFIKTEDSGLKESKGRH